MPLTRSRVSNECPKGLAGLNQRVRSQFACSPLQKMEVFANLYGIPTLDRSFQFGHRFIGILAPQVDQVEHEVEVFA